MADSERHGQDSQAEGQSYTRKPDAQSGKSSCEDRAPATAEYQPERPKAFRP